MRLAEDFLYTRISGSVGPFILAPAEGWWVGLRPIPWDFGPITIQSMDDLGRVQGRYPENFVLISQLEVSQEGGGSRKQGTCWTLRFSDQRYGGQGCQCHYGCSW